MPLFKGFFCCFPCKKKDKTKIKEKDKKKEDVKKPDKNGDVVVKRRPERRLSDSLKNAESVANRMSKFENNFKDVSEIQRPLKGHTPYRNPTLWEPKVKVRTVDRPKSCLDNQDIRRSQDVKITKDFTHFYYQPVRQYSFNKEDEFTDFAAFAEANQMMKVLNGFSSIRNGLEIDHEQRTFTAVFPKLREGLKHKIPNKYDRLLQLLETRSRSKEYAKNTAAEGKRVLVLGAGPCGLRLAMETQFLGAETTVMEARTEMTRNNVLRLWPFVMEDLKSLGAKTLYQKLDHGSINHISIWMLQLILLKMVLLLGIQVRAAETFKQLVEPTESKGWVVISERLEKGETVKIEAEYDMVFCATGKKVPVEGFERTSQDRRMAIAITANWTNYGTPEERKVEEIAGLAKQNRMEFFKALEDAHDICLENLVHFKDKTHYFVMTATKESLLKKGVLRENTKDRESLLHADNVNTEALEQYALDAATFSTGYFSTSLPSLPLEDKVSIFDFTNLYSSKQACKVRERKGHRLLMGLVGDSLVEPFWPEGLGISRGFLSVFDTAWMAKRFSTESKDQVYELLQEREKLYSLQKTADNKLNQNFQQWSIKPSTRYPASMNPDVKMERILEQFDTDVK